MVIFFVFGCDNTKEANQDSSSLTTAKASSKTAEKKTTKIAREISFKDLVGTWQGGIGEISFSLYEDEKGKAGIISFYDYHDDGALFFFDNYKENGDRF